MWKILDAEKRVGLKLTESLAMVPASSVSALVFSHKRSQYFAAGSLAEDQIKQYTEEKGATLKETQRWLAPNLGYEPEEEE